MKCHIILFFSYCTLFSFDIAFSIDYTPLSFIEDNGVAFIETEQTEYLVKLEDFYGLRTFDDAYPFLILDCKRSEYAFKQGCFEVLNYISKRLRYAGIFQEIHNLSMFNFIYSYKKDHFRVTNFSEYPPYIHKELKQMIYFNYFSLMKAYIDKNERYLLVSVKPIDNYSLSDLKGSISELIAYREYKNLNFFFFNEKTFDSLYKHFFLNRHLRFYIDLSNTLQLKSNKLPNLLDALEKTIESDSTLTSLITVLDGYFVLNNILEGSQHHHKYLSDDLWSNVLNYLLFLPDRYAFMLNKKGQKICLLFETNYASGIETKVIVNILKKIRGVVKEVFPQYESSISIYYDSFNIKES